MVNNFTSYLLNSSNLINNALASNMRVYNTALEQTRDNVKACAKTNTNFIQSVNSQNREVNSRVLNNTSLLSDTKASIYTKNTFLKLKVRE